MNMLCLGHHFKFILSEIRYWSHFYILTDQLLEGGKESKQRKYVAFNQFT